MKIIDNERIRAKGQRDIKNKLFLDFENGTLTNELIKNSDADAETKSSLRTQLILRAQGREDPPPPPAERAEYYTELSDAIDATDPEDVAAIDDAIDWHVANRYISVAQGNSLSKRLNLPANLVRSRFEKDLKKRITGTNAFTGQKDPVGDKYAEKAQFVIDDAVQEAIENDVPLYRLFDPRTDEGKELRKRLTPFQRTMGEILDDMVKELAKKTKKPPPSTATNDAIIKAIVDSFDVGN